MAGIHLDEEQPWKKTPKVMKRRTKQVRQDRHCYQCGGSGHVANNEECPAQGHERRKCHHMNHFTTSRYARVTESANCVESKKKESEDEVGGVDLTTTTNARDITRKPSAAQPSRQIQRRNKAKTKKKGLSVKALRSTEVVEEPCMDGPRRKVRYAIL